MVKKITRNLTGTYFSSNSSVQFDSNPYLLPGNEVILFFPSTNDRADINVVSSNTITNNVVVAYTNNQYNNERVTVTTPCFCSGVSGYQAPFSINTATTPNIILQATKDLGSANVVSANVEVTVDGIGWLPIYGFALGSANTTDALNITEPWAQARINFSSIPAATSVRITRSA